MNSYSQKVNKNFMQKKVSQMNLQGARIAGQQRRQDLIMVEIGEETIVSTHQGYHVIN